MGYKTYRKIVEISGLKTPEFLKREIEAKKIYDAMYFKIKSLGFAKKVPTNPFSISSEFYLKEILDYIESNYTFDLSGEYYSWPTFEKDMCEVSLNFPNRIIKVHGEGDANKDIWDAWFLNGKFTKKQYEVKTPELEDVSELKEYRVK